MTQTQAAQGRPEGLARLQFVVRTFDPAGDRAFSHVFVKARRLAGLRMRRNCRLAASSSAAPLGLMI